MSLQPLKEYLSNIRLTGKKLVYHEISMFHILKALNLLSEEYQIIIKLTRGLVLLSNIRIDYV